MKITIQKDRNVKTEKSCVITLTDHEKYELFFDFVTHITQNF